MLPKRARVAKGKDWYHLHRQGQQINGPNLVVKYLYNRQPITRFGFVVGTKVSKKSTVRNLLKRRLREVIKGYTPKIKEGYDLVVITRPSAANQNYQDLKKEILILLKRARLINL